MDLTLKNYKSTLPPELIRKSQRCLVRECDEIRPGHFESYVDELEQSFDVSITFDKTIIAAHQCDCLDSAPICQHKAALLSDIAKGNNKVLPKITKAKKVDPILKALEDADPQSLREWIFKVTKKNKDLGLAFLHEFSEKQLGYTPEEIKATTNDAVKAVINKRIKADANEVKKIVELWTGLHRSIIDGYLAEPGNEKHFFQLHTIIETCSFYEERLCTSSKRIGSYLTKILDEVSSVISIIRDQQAWQKCLGYFVAEIFRPDFGFRKRYLDVIVSLFNSSAPERKTDLVDAMVKLYENKKSAPVQDRNDFAQSLLRLVTAIHAFPTYKHLFLPIRHALSYNIKLIDLMLAEGDLESAERYCIGQINENTREDFDFEYLSRLRNIYKTTGQDEKLVGVVKQLLLHLPDFLDYQFVTLHQSADTEFKRWRSRVLANARQMAYFDRDAADFSLAIMNMEKNYKGLIEYIDDNVNYRQILPYAKVLTAVHPQSFLDRMVSKMDCPDDKELQEEEPELLNQSLEDIYLILLNHFKAEDLKLIAKKRLSLYRGWSNLFVKYLSIKFVLQ